VLSLVCRFDAAPAERIFVVLMMVVGLLWGALVISNMSAVIQVSDAGSTQVIC
jgi:hypothetical protein